MSSKGDTLRNSGFDTSHYDKSAQTWIVGCSQCCPDVDYKETAARATKMLVEATGTKNSSPILARAW